MDSKMNKYGYRLFDNIKQFDNNGVEFWSARDLQKVLEYTKWDNFVNVINKAKKAVENSNIEVSDHFADVSKMVDIGVAHRDIQDIALSRYACYIIVQNSDPRKEVVALGQTYFAIKTRQQELNEEFENLNEDEKRLGIRNEIKEHNKSLAEAANMAGISTPQEYAIFQNYGYRGLYGGLTAKDIHKRKGLKKTQQILDHMGSTELAANLFRATQTDEKLRRDKVKGKIKANAIHYEVGKKVRDTIKELGGTMPEDLPTPEKSIKSIEKEIDKKKLQK